MKKYELINHTADIGIKVYGKSLNELFENAGLAMFEIIAWLKKIKKKHIIEFKVEANSFEELMQAWLSQLLLKFNLEKFLFVEFKVRKICKNYLFAEAYGEIFNPLKHKLKREIKLVTYHQLELKKENNIYQMQIIFDL